MVVTISADVGALIIAVTVWQIARHGLPDSTDRFDDHWPSGG